MEILDSNELMRRSSWRSWSDFIQYIHNRIVNRECNSDLHAHSNQTRHQSFIEPKIQKYITDYSSYRCCIGKRFFWAYAAGPSFLYIFITQSEKFLYFEASNPCILVLTTSIGVLQRAELAPAMAPNKPIMVLGTGTFGSPLRYLSFSVSTMKSRIAWFEPCFSKVGVRPWYIPRKPETEYNKRWMQSPKY